MTESSDEDEPTEPNLSFAMMREYCLKHQKVVIEVIRAQKRLTRSNQLRRLCRMWNCAEDGTELDCCDPDECRCVGLVGLVFVSCLLLNYCVCT
jgi:hypothetical protein